MEELKAFQMSVISAVMMVILAANSVRGQIRTPCTTSMISSFTPCANLITGSSNNGTVPSNTCCETMRSLVNTSVDCACLVISANVPFQLPISTALVLSLAQACNINGLPSQCKASGSPLPAPGPALLDGNSPSLPPMAASPLSPQVSEEMARANRVSKFMNRRLAQAEALAVAPSPVEEVPSRTGGIRPILTPPSSASNPSFASPSPFMTLVFIPIMLVSFYWL